MNNICLILGEQYTGAFTDVVMEDIYSRVLGPFCSLLYANQKCNWTFYFSGPQLEWFEKYHPEFAELAAEMSDRKQIELIGGGFYEPIMPLLIPADRVAQIEHLTTTLRRFVGKRPRGAKLICDIWDPSLILTLYKCNFEYILLDSSLISSKDKLCYPFITEDMGRSICILPETQQYLPAPEESPHAWLNRLDSSLPGSDIPAAAVCRFDIPLCMKLLETGWFRDLFTVLPEYKDRLETILPYRYIRSVPRMEPVYVPASVTSDLARYAQRLSGKNNSLLPMSIQEWLLACPQSRNFYMKMINTSNLIYQSRCGDKARKISAYEKLYEAQNGAACLGFGKYGISGIKQQQDAYRSLLQAERYITEAGKSVGGIPLCFDVNADGKQEYIFKQHKYTLGITPNGGSIFMFDVQNVSCISGLRRNLQLDGVQDLYDRNLFVDHLIPPQLLDQYMHGIPIGNTVFSQCFYRPKTQEQPKKDLQLIAEGYYGEHRQKIVLRKSYVCSPDGIQVRFILMNNDSNPVSAVFATELTFEVPIQKPSEVSAEILLGDNLECYEESDMSARTVQYEGVSIVRLSNQSANLSLVFEPNECAGYCQYPVSFCRPPDCYAAESVMNKVPVGKSLSCTFYWNVDIEPGHNIEKTLSMGITTPPKRRRHGRD